MERNIICYWYQTYLATALQTSNTSSWVKKTQTHKHTYFEHPSTFPGCRLELILAAIWHWKENMKPLVQLPNRRGEKKRFTGWSLSALVEQWCNSRMLKIEMSRNPSLQCPNSAVFTMAQCLTHLHNNQMPPDIVAGLWAPLCIAAFRVYSWFPGTLVFLHPTRLLSTGNQLWLLCHATGALLHLPEQLFRGKKNLPLWSTVTVIQESLCFCQHSTKTLAVLWSVSLNNEMMVLPPCSSHIETHSFQCS